MDQVAEGDRVVTRWTAQGTHKGELMGMAPTGKRVTLTATDIDRIANGKVVECWSSLDGAAMMQQMGIVPTPG
jgi:predicted ester cyclase